MFKQLLPFVAARPLTITIAGVEDGKIRLNIVPHSTEKDRRINDKITHANRDDIAAVPDSSIQALTTPLSVVGTPEELDTDLPALLTQFVEQHASLQQSVDRASQEIADAVKAVEERKKVEAKAKGGKKAEQTEPAGKGDTKQEQNTTGNGTQTSLPMAWCVPPAVAQEAAPANDGGK
jgi:PRTRC genetic system protein E